MRTERIVTERLGKIQYVGREQISEVISFSRENVGGKMARGGGNEERTEKI